MFLEHEFSFSLKFWGLFPVLSSYQISGLSEIVSEIYYTIWLHIILIFL